MLCANGGALVVTLDDAGREQSVERTPQFFDPEQRPGDGEGGPARQRVAVRVVRGTDPSRRRVRSADSLREKWSLVDDADRTGKWRVGGGQHLAVHAPSGRLYALMHQGEKDTHKNPGTEVWVYDLAGRRRVQRITLMNPLLSFVGQQMGLGEQGRTGGGTAWLLAWMLPKPGRRADRRHSGRRARAAHGLRVAAHRDGARCDDRDRRARDHRARHRRHALLHAVTMDPAIDLTIRATLALLFAVAAVHKLRDMAAFRGTFADYRLLPDAAAWAVPAAEAAVALLLVAPATSAVGKAGAVALLVAYAAAIGVNLARGAPAHRLWLRRPARAPADRPPASSSATRSSRPPRSRRWRRCTTGRSSGSTRSR
jgi:uncharacterized membrane protein YphA (DoxX/SURF4 family)